MIETTRPMIMPPRFSAVRDSNRSAPLPASSPTLSPTLSAIAAGFLGSSSGKFSSTFPTRSAPTSADLVNIPPLVARTRPRVKRIKALMRENKEILWGSMVKQTMQRKKPTFNEEYYGYNTFSDLLGDAQTYNIIKINKDIKSGSYVITGFAQPAA